MLKSQVVEIDGRFIGAVVHLPAGFRFVAADLRVEELDGSFWSSPTEARRVAGLLFRTGRLPAAAIHQ